MEVNAIKVLANFLNSDVFVKFKYWQLQCLVLHCSLACSAQVILKM